MSTVVYLQTDRNIKIQKADVYLQDIASVICSDPEMLMKLKRMKVCVVDARQYGRYPMSISEVIEKIQKIDSKIEVSHIGEPQFILTYENDAEKQKVITYFKIIFVCLITFFGTAFSIMTFHNDVDITGLFRGIYERMMGVPSDGFTILEISYSIGIGLGAVFFFNHFGKRKLTQDPTPMEVEMRTYEDDVDATIIEQKERKQLR